MSKQSYAKGFAKAAESKNVNPEALARYVMSKKAEGSSGIWDRVKAIIGDAKKWWDDPQNQAWRPLVGAGVGAGLGTGLGAALHGKKGLRHGAILGALGGGLGAVNWAELSKALDELKEESKNRELDRKTYTEGHKMRQDNMNQGATQNAYYGWNENGEDPEDK